MWKGRSQGPVVAAARPCHHILAASIVLPATRQPAPLKPATPLPARTQAIVGEFGLDRSSVVPGTRLQPSWEHQLLLVKTHLALAVELHRPVSMHCVQVVHAGVWRAGCG